jgi:hypothetical protein
MTSTDVILVLVSVATGLAINEMSDVSPWLAGKLVRIAASSATATLAEPMPGPRNIRH